MIGVGSIVSRISYNNDVIFVVDEIKDNVAKLRGLYIRLIADAKLDDLKLSDERDEFNPDDNMDLMDRNEYFYLPGKILHLDSDQEYINKSLDFYSKCGVLAICKRVLEKDIPNVINDLLVEHKPDILVLTGHDAFNNKSNDINNINNYKNSKYYAKGVNIARDYEKSHEKLVIIAGACQSDYEDIIKSGANFASSPKRVNIHALDPAIIAVNVALTEKDKNIDIKTLLSKTRYGKDGMGGLFGKGMMYVGYPR